MKYEKLYSASPVWVQNLMCSIYGYRLRRARYDAAYARLEEDVRAREWMMPSVLEEYQRMRLRQIIAHAAATVPYYRRLFAQQGIGPADIREPADLAQLPIVSKKTVQENWKDFCSDRLGEMTTSTVHTSGTTGTGLIFPMTREAERTQWATWWRYRARFGIDRSTWHAHFYGRSVVPLQQRRPPLLRVNRPGRQILFSGYHMRDELLGYYVDELNRRRPPWIQGYPSLLAVLAGYMQATGRTLDYRPRVVTIGAESLLAYQKRLIEQAFGARCRQHYGMTEAVANISECPAGRLHVDEDFGYVEFLPQGDGTHRVIATGWANEAFVLLRYDVGDTVTLPADAAPCPCGRPGRIVESIDGRVEDYVVTPEGNRIGRLDHILKDMIHVRECQIVQDRIDSVEFRVVRGPRFTQEDARVLLEEARKRLGRAMEIKIVYVDRVERTKEGKIRLVISRLPQGRLVPQEACCR